MTTNSAESTKCKLKNQLGSGRLYKQFKKDIAGFFVGINRERMVLLALGNPMRGDDGFGPMVAKELEGHISVRICHGGTTPENELPKIISMNPDLVVLVDAVDFLGRPGELRFFPPQDVPLGNSSVSTHCASIETMRLFLCQSREVNIALIGLQPLSTSIGEELSLPARQAVGSLCRILRAELH